MPVNRVSDLNAKWIALAIASLALLSTLAMAKSNKPILPGYILNARTVTVIIDPATGISLSDPNANQTAQRDVETAPGAEEHHHATVCRTISGTYLRRIQAPTKLVGAASQGKP